MIGQAKSTQTLRFFLIAAACMTASSVWAALPWQMTPEDRQSVRALALAAAKSEQPKAAALDLAAIQDLKAKLAQLQGALASLPKDEAGMPPAEVEVYAQAVELAVENGECASPAQRDLAARVLDWGVAAAAEASNDPGLLKKARGAFALGHRSPIDRTAQPYAIALPDGFDPASQAKYRLYVHLDETAPGRTETAFLAAAYADPLPSEHAQTIVIRPFGRGGSDWGRLAEADIFEAIDDAVRRYPIDPNQIVLGGFGNGGTAALRIGLGRPDRFAALAPLAISYSAKALPTVEPPFAMAPPNVAKIQEMLARPEGLDGLAENAFGLPILLGVGEADPLAASQTAALSALLEAGAKAQAYVVPKAGHEFAPLLTTQRREFLQTPQIDPDPLEIRFATANLRHAERRWIRIEGMTNQYTRAKIRAKVDPKTNGLTIDTSGVSGFSIRPGEKVISHKKNLAVIVDGVSFTVIGGSPWTDLYFEHDEKGWRFASQSNGPRKRPGLQGPIDDAFATPFLCVRPTGKPWSETTGRWTESLLAAFEDSWRRDARGRLPMKTDREVGPEDWKRYNIVLFGDGSSNPLIAEFLKESEAKHQKDPKALPIFWSAKFLKLGAQYLPGVDCAPIMILPNPRNPDRCLAINAVPNFAWTRFAEKGLSREAPVPPLADFALLKIEAPKPGANGAAPRAQVICDSFFNESWQMPRF